MKKKDFDPNNYNKLNNLRKKIIKDTSSFINMDNKKIIEIGSGNGNFSKLLSKKFNSSYIYGIDIVSQYIDFSKKIIIIIISNLKRKIYMMLILHMI